MRANDSVGDKGHHRRLHTLVRDDGKIIPHHCPCHLKR